MEEKGRDKGGMTALEDKMQKPRQRNMEGGKKGDKEKGELQRGGEKYEVEGRRE